ncbi:hypothetical protein ACN47E_004397 [Coniothyrium glycines]
MAGPQAHAVAQQDPPHLRERPWLLPYNRKLRHLQGITIRNLTLTPDPRRSRTKTIDDEGLPSALKSPTKALAQRESKSLAHSRSSSDLQSSEDATRRSGASRREPALPTKPVRPSFGKGLRRRTTMEWTNASPLTRQKRLEDITAGRMADTFFTLHVPDQKEPVYISEVSAKAMNPNFKFFDLAPCGPNVTRLDRLTVRVWAKSETMSEWQYLMDYTVQLRALQFIGKDMGRFRHPLPQNCILFHMTDGIYTSFTDLPVQERARQEVLAPPKENADGRVLTSSSYDALMRLSTLDDCIQDALATRDRIAEEIEDILESNKVKIGKIEQVPESEESLRIVEAAVTSEKRRVIAIRRKRDDLQANLNSRREKMRLGLLEQNSLANNLPQERTAHTSLQTSVSNLSEAITGQRRRICEDLLSIYPIEPIPAKPLTFTIRTLPLPNTVFESIDTDTIAAALSYVAQLVTSLATYFAVLLPYPITLHGSTSTIEDPLALGNAKTPTKELRIYPLYMRNVVRYRFDYAVFLLNKNIEILSNALGLRPVDIRHTLPNLKYLLYIATAGVGELPARRAGGIRGLLRMDGSAGKERRDSVDSYGTESSAGTPREEVQRNLEAVGMKAKRGGDGNGNGNGAVVYSMKPKVALHAGSRLRPVE